MELKKFRNKYDLELIPASHENIILGTLVWDPLIGAPKFQHDGMPNNIFNSFLDAELLNESEWANFLENARKETIVEANFSESTINVDSSVVTSLEHPIIGKIGNEFELKKVSKFTFGDLQVRTMSNLTRIRVDNYLESLKKDNWEDYDGKIRRVFMITELYYGSVKLITSTEWKSDFDAKVSQLDIELTNTIEFGKSVEYTFDHKNVPFAMRIEKVREFNG